MLICKKARHAAALYVARMGRLQNPCGFRRGENDHANAGGRHGDYFSAKHWLPYSIEQ